MITDKCTDLHLCNFPNIVTCGRHASINMIPELLVKGGGFANRTFEKSGTVYRSDFHPTLKLPNMFAGASAYATLTDAILGKIINSAVEKDFIPRTTALYAVGHKLRQQPDHLELHHHGSPGGVRHLLHRD